MVSLYQNSNGKQYVVKHMLNQWDEEYYERFRREIIVMADVDHQNILKVLNHGVLNNNPWYMMPHFKEGSLREKLINLKTRGQIYSAKGASGFIYYLAGAISAAHEFGLIHRDIKPENILFKGKVPIIADWGIGKFIHKRSKVFANIGLGTKAYCSPEQWEGGVSDGRSDIYSLGLVYRELLTGSLTGKIEDQQIKEIVKKMTAIRPASRYQLIGEVMQAIESLNIISSTNPMKDFWGEQINMDFFRSN